MSRELDAGIVKQEEFLPMVGVGGGKQQRSCEERGGEGFQGNSTGGGVDWGMDPPRPAGRGWRNLTKQGGPFRQAGEPRIHLRNAGMLVLGAGAGRSRGWGGRFGQKNQRKQVRKLASGLSLVRPVPVAALMMKWGITSQKDAREMRRWGAAGSAGLWRRHRRGIAPGGW